MKICKKNLFGDLKGKVNLWIFRLDDSRVFDNRDDSSFLQSSPKNNKNDKKENVDYKKILEIERLEMEAEYEAQKNQLAADWQQLEKKHHDDIAELVSRKAELEGENKLLENSSLNEAYKVDRFFLNCILFKHDFSDGSCQKRNCCVGQYAK